MKNNSIAIAGAGISGMSTAYVLAQQGYKVQVHAEAFSPNITSNKAAAFWFPYHIRNDKRGIEWGQVTYDFYKELCNDVSTGISMKRLVKVLRTGVEEEEPIWKEFMPEGSCRQLPEEALLAGQQTVYEVEVPLIETQLFLPWLQKQLIAKGVSFTQRHITDLDKLFAEAPIVINCTALGSRVLCNDDSLIPVRGQVGLLKPGPELPMYLDNEKPLYIVPRKDHIIIGGTYEEHVEEAITEEATIERLLNNAYEVYPFLKEQTVLGSWAGLRPYRPVVRVEKEPGKNIIHNYGHGGSGFTLAFGCAGSVLEMVNDIEMG